MKPAERPRLAETSNSDQRGKLGERHRDLGWSEGGGAEQYRRSGAQGGATLLSWEMQARKTFVFEQSGENNVSTKASFSPRVAKRRIDFFC